jgi:hypothetical protein
LQLVPATSGGLEVVYVEVIQPKLDEPNLPCAFDLAVAEAVSKFHPRTGSAIVTPPIIPAASGESRSILSTLTII